MKKTVMFILLLTSFAAFALPQNGDEYLTNIGIGTSLKALKDIEINPNQDMVRLNKSSCYIHLKKIVPYKRILREGRVLTITATNRRDRHPSMTVLKVDNVNIRSIFCNEGVYLSRTKVYDFEKAVEGIMKITFGTPQEI